MKKKETKNSDIEYRIKNKSAKWYFISISTIILSIIVGIVLVLLKIQTIYIILYFVIVFPIFFIANGIFLIRLYSDRKKIKMKLVKKLSSNFIIAEFLFPNKNSIPYIKPITSEKRFIHEEGLYFIEEESIYKDNDGYPKSYYIPNVSQPLKFNIKKDSKVNITYSATNLMKFYKDKFFHELHNDPNQRIPTTNIITWVLLGLILLIVLYMLMTRNPVNV